MDAFHQVDTKLSIMYLRVVSTENRALNILLDKAHTDKDKKKSIVIFLLHLLRKHSMFIKNEYLDGANSPNSGPCSPSTRDCINDVSRNGINNESHVSRINPFDTDGKGTLGRLGSIPVPPEEFRCPISLQLMSDPVTISFVQTYGWVFIKKWISEGHGTCPKTQQKLTHV